LDFWTNNLQNLSMKSKPRRHYAPEFKAQAVAMLQTGRPVSQLGQELGISDNLLYSWRQASQRARRAAAKDRKPQASGTQRTSCARCAATSPPQDGERHSKKGRGHPRHQSPARLRAMIEQIKHATGYPRRPICQVLGVPRTKRDAGEDARCRSSSIDDLRSGQSSV
jgi:transposase-like protein